MCQNFRNKMLPHFIIFLLPYSALFAFLLTSLFCCGSWSRGSVIIWHPGSVSVMLNCLRFQIRIRNSELWFRIRVFTNLSNMQRNLRFGHKKALVGSGSVIQDPRIPIGKNIYGNTDYSWVFLISRLFCSH